MAAKRVSLSRYLRYRLGEGNDVELLKAMIARAFTARSFSDFWRYWNPVYGYALDRWCYRPLHRVLPRPVAVVLTFTACGFLLHDVPFGWAITFATTGRVSFPLIGAWFLLIGLAVVAGEALRLDFRRLGSPCRVLLHVAHLVLPFLAAWWLSTTLR